MSSRTDASIRNDRLLLSGRYSPTECENVDLVDALGKYISNSKLGSGRLALPESFGYFENLARVLMQLPKKLSSARTLCQFATTARPATFDLEAMLLRGGLCSAIESLETTPDHQKRKELARVPGIDAEDVATLAACGITDSAKLRAELSSSKPQWTPRTEERKKLALGYLNLGSRPEPLLDLETSLQLKTAILKRLQANPALLDEKLFIEQTGSLGAGRLTAPSAEFILSKQNAWTPDELAVVIKWLTKDFHVAVAHRPIPESAQPLCVAVLSTPAMARFDRARLPMGISKYEEVPFARLVQQGPDANTYLSTLWFAASSNHATIQALTRSTKGYGEALFRVARSMQFVLHGTGLYDEAGWAANHAPLEIESEEELFAKLKVPYRRCSDRQLDIAQDTLAWSGRKGEASVAAAASGQGKSKETAKPVEGRHEKKEVKRDISTALKRHRAANGKKSGDVQTDEDEEEDDTHRPKKSKSRSGRVRDAL